MVQQHGATSLHFDLRLAGGVLVSWAVPAVTVPSDDTTKVAETMNQVLERGDIYFAYRPRVERERVRDIEDVQRLFMILQPSGGRRNTRRIIVGRKRLPAPTEHERFWGFVDEVAERPAAVAADLERVTYRTRTRGERTQPEARPAGEGRYAIIRHGDHTHLTYELELPTQPGAVQAELEIEPEASYIVAVKNPRAPTPQGAGLPSVARPDLPEPLQARFGSRRFIAADSDLLDHEGVELVLIGAGADVESELGVRLDTEAESTESAEAFRRLRMAPEEHPTEPLTEGDWR